MPSNGKWRDWRDDRDKDVEERIHEKKCPTLTPRTPGQQVYLHAIQDHRITFCDGPSGSGKSYIPLVHGLQKLHRREIKQLILCRPLMECGREMGYFPGDPLAKMRPYFQPLIDTLEEVLSPDDLAAYLREEQIVFRVPELMRGSTLKNCLTLIDEGQNYSKKQMQMLLTRLGENSKLVISGDSGQIDLVGQQETALQWTMRLLIHPKIGRVRLTEADIVRSGDELLAFIIRTLGVG